MDKQGAMGLGGQRQGRMQTHWQWRERERKTTIWGPGHVIPDSPLDAATRLEMETGTQVIGVPIHTDMSVTPVEDHLTALLSKFASTCTVVASLPDAQCAHALMRSSPYSWVRTSKIELPDVEPSRQHWWSTRLTQVKAMSLQEAAAGRDIPRLEVQQVGKPGGWISPPRI